MVQGQYMGHYRALIPVYIEEKKVETWSDGMNDLISAW